MKLPPNNPMKQITLVLLAITAICFADSLSDKATQHLKEIRADGSLTNVVKALCDQGDVCKIRGEHAWTFGRPGEGPNFMFADYHPATSFEHCVICNATKTRTTTESKWIPENLVKDAK